MRFFGKSAPKGAAWLDAHYDEGTQRWMWADGSVVTYFNWAEKQPVLTKGALIQVLGADGTWSVTTGGRTIDVVLDTQK